MGYKIGVCGLNFGSHFAQLFDHHPLVDEVVLCDLRREKIEHVAKEFGIKGRTAASFDELIKMDIDGVAIFTQRWTHAHFAIQALKAGKHVYCAVPAGVDVDEMEELVKTVEETGLTYALGETSFYRPQAIWCRRKFAEGAFGNFVYGEGQYYHDMAHWFYLPFYDSGGENWKQYASVPPMWYISHSCSHVLSVTFSRMTHVSCFGYHDKHEDGLFRKELSAFDNDFSNQSALFRTADGGMARINEFRRTGAGESRGSIIGTDGAYEEQANPCGVEHTVLQQMEGTEGLNALETAATQAVFTKNYFEKPPYKEDGSYDYVNAQHWAKRQKEDLTWIHRMAQGVEITEENLGNLPREFLGKRHLGVSPMHPVERLPKEFVGVRNGHAGSHQFLVQDFLEAIDTGKLPPNHVWLGVRYSLPGVIAHESSKREGERMSIPDFGLPPAGMECIDPLVNLQK